MKINKEFLKKIAENSAIIADYFTIIAILFLHANKKTSKGLTLVVSENFINKFSDKQKEIIRGLGLPQNLPVGAFYSVA